MPERIQMSRKQILILFGGVLVMSFLGMVAGSYFIQQKTAKATKNPGLLLKKGDVFPEFAFEGLESGQPHNRTFITGKKSVLIFFTSDCGHCVKTIERWDSIYNNISTAYQILGVSFEALEKIRHYRLSNNVQIPLYRDTNGKFTGQYKILKYPTIIGVGEKGKVAFVEVGNHPQKPVEEYLKML